MKVSQADLRSRSNPRSLAETPELFTSDPLIASGEPAPGSYNDEFVIRGAITTAIRNCRKSREVIAEEMSRLLGATVTKRSLDSYTSESADQNRFPAQYTRAFCYVTGDWSLLRCVTERAGLHVISASERKLLELGRQYLIGKRAAEAVSRLELELAEVTL